MFNPQAMSHAPLRRGKLLNGGTVPRRWRDASWTSGRLGSQQQQLPATAGWHRWVGSKDQLVPGQLMASVVNYDVIQQGWWVGCFFEKSFIKINGFWEGVQECPCSGPVILKTVGTYVLRIKQCYYSWGVHALLLLNVSYSPPVMLTMNSNGQLFRIYSSYHCFI